MRVKGEAKRGAKKDINGGTIGSEKGERKSDTKVESIYFCNTNLTNQLLTFGVL